MTVDTSQRNLFRTSVQLNKPLCDEHYLLRLRVSDDQPAGPFPDTRPGQFIQLGCSQPLSDRSMALCEHEWDSDNAAAFPKIQQQEFLTKEAFLRRPFSLAGHRTLTENGIRVHELDIIHRVVGVGTSWLADLNAGDPLELIGPLGNWFDLTFDAQENTDKKPLALLLGGGVGLPPMLYLAEQLNLKGWESVAFVGAMRKTLLPVSWTDVTPDESGSTLFSVSEFKAHNVPAIVTTDDGSFGLKGRITDGLNKYLETADLSDRTVRIFTCGPGPMMAAIYKIAQQQGIHVEACVEQAMACGMGTCQSCIVKGIARDDETPHGEIEQNSAKVNWRYRLACHDGPVFDAKNLIW